MFMSGHILRLAQKLASRSQVTAGLESFVLCLVICFSLTGNVLVCCAVWRNHQLRTLSNIFVVALAISDIFMAALCMPFTLGTLIRGEWVFGHLFCQLNGFLVLTFGMISLHTMGLISVNRYFCIVKSATYRRLFKTRRTLIYVAVVWLNTLIVSVPPFFLNFGGYAFQPGKAMCLYTFEANIGYTIFIETVYIGFALTLIVSCYSAVFMEVYKTNKVFALTQQSADHLRAHVQETKITKTLAVVFLGFVVCWLPVSTIDLLDAVNGNPEFKRQVYLTYTFLVYISSFINPVIYGVVSRTFRREYWIMLRRFICCPLCVRNFNVADPSVSR